MTAPYYKFKKYFFLFNILLLVTAFPAKAQPTDTARITATFQDMPLELVLQQLQERYALCFFYPPNTLPPEVKITLTLKQELLPQALTKILKPSQLNFILYSPVVVVLVKDAAKNLAQSKTPADTSAPAKITDAAVKRTYKTTRPASGNTVRVSGNITVKSTGENIVGATILVEELKVGATTNDNGFYSVSVPPGTYTFVFNSVGYRPERQRVTLRSNFILNVDLTPNSLQLKEVTVLSEAPDQNITKLEMSTTKLDMKTIKKIPAFLGEIDVVKSVQLLPGVTTVGEGASGFNVRGGSADQNLILLDEAPVYNSSHLFGLFSVFNPDVIKDVTLYRGGIPAQYGGRASSVLDITLKDTHVQKITGRGGIGLVSNRLSLEGPLQKDKSYFILAGRTSLADLVLKAVPNKILKNTGVSFFDINGKLDYKLNRDNRLSFSVYVGKDRFKLAADSVSSLAANATSTVFSWVNTNATLRWTHDFNPKLSLRLAGIYADYISDVLNPEGPNTYRLRSGISNKILKADFSYVPNDQHQFTFGIHFNHYQVRPGSLIVDEKKSTINPVYLPSEYGLETALYLNDEYRLTSKFSILYGLRFAVFQVFGSGKVYTYAAGQPREPETITDTLFYNSNKVQQTYQGPEPRLAFKYNLTENSSLKLSYNRLRQYVHLVTNTTSITPTDRWKLSDRYLKPQVSDQIALGYFHNFRENTIETSLEIYYKTVQNIPDYKNGATLLLNKNLERDILAGRGQAYGLEGMVRKTFGQITGWASYTYSRTFLQVSGSLPEESINQGKYYPANFDKPHLLNLVFTNQVNRRLSYSASFMYSTGRPATYPAAKYVIRGVIVPHYPSRNQERIPDYHRLDFSFTYDGNHRRNKKWDGSWTFSVYNVYSRNNAFSIFFRNQQAYKLSILGSAFPSVTYNFKF